MYRVYGTFGGGDCGGGETYETYNVYAEFPTVDSMWFQNTIDLYSEITDKVIAHVDRNKFFPTRIIVED